MHKLLLKIQSFYIYLEYAKSLMSLIYCIVKDKGDMFFITKLHINCHHKKMRDYWPLGHTNVFVYIDDNNNRKIALIICLVENKF
jgi:hypothetical protein